MNANALIKHVQPQGVTLRKAGDPVSPLMQVDVVPAFVALDGDAAPASSWWGVPVYVVRQWIAKALRRGDYRSAAAYSALIPRPTPLVKAAPTPTPLVVCTHSLAWGGVGREDDDDLIRFRMRRSARNFRRGLAGSRVNPDAATRVHRSRQLLPLV